MTPGPRFRHCPGLPLVSFGKTRGFCHHSGPRPEHGLDAATWETCDTGIRACSHKLEGDHGDAGSPAVDIDHGAVDEQSLIAGQVDRSVGDSVGGSAPSGRSA